MTPLLDTDVDLSRITESIFVSIDPQYHPQLQTMLLWLNPNETTTQSATTMTIDLKNCINIIVSTYGKDDQIRLLFKKYYSFVIKLHFMKDNRPKNMTSIREFHKLENLYLTPLRFTYDLIDTNEMQSLINIFKRYLINNNFTFRKNVLHSMETLFLTEDQFEFQYNMNSLNEIVIWLNDANGNVSPIDLLLDLLLRKIEKFCQREMAGLWNGRFIIMEKFNLFINQYWKLISKLFHHQQFDYGDVENDHALTNLIYYFFTQQFIKIRINESLKIMVSNFPISTPTIIELKNVLITSSMPRENVSTTATTTFRDTNLSEEYLKLFVKKFLKDFQRKFLNPCIPTIPLIRALVKMTNSFLILDPRGQLLTTIILTLKPLIQRRTTDIVNILLYAMLNLNEMELHKLGCNIDFDIESFNILVSELYPTIIKSMNQNQNNPSVVPYTTAGTGTTCSNERITNDDIPYQNVKDMANANTMEYLARRKPETKPFFDLFKQYLEWVPPMNKIYDSTSKNTVVDDEETSRIRSRHAIDYLFRFFDSIDLLLSEYLKLLTEKFIHSKNYYTLDNNWLWCLNLLKEKSNSSNVPDENVKSTINTIDIMLNDMKRSASYGKDKKHTKENNMVQGDIGFYPKEVSKLYWKINSTNIAKWRMNMKGDFFHLLKYSKTAEPNHTMDIKLNRFFNELGRKGKKMELYKDKSLMEMKISFDDGRELFFDNITIEQYDVLSLFTVEKGAAFTLEKAYDFFSGLKRGKQKLEECIQFWVDKKVLYLDDDDGCYKVLERLTFLDEIKQRKKMQEETVIKSDARMGIDHDYVQEAAEDDDIAGFETHKDVISRANDEIKNILDRIFPFINGMLENLGSMKLEKIHSFLKMTVPRDFEYNRIAIHQLENYLNGLVEDEKLETTTDGAFKKPK
ncbi:anaphase promoting complex subunit 2 NDAI_0G02600 [Naumovozyma dairenensis CBS 421]|uniref:Anaphase-promoting complex subunit 2 n=1 Tax=Naumovozyma dairenensis (strain ATCC 10597 / BCRC 20456 / CBS 421 / NBRC 0211 / NRRL Y-12639) TaxID=1071378 RepID=G0WE26_NAUDC|nr:hypothetical protein NDAI_0G02600 [Naumovozyma dairenensis CBS 421]CCD26037.2 hypothetical protein NDAI_0G02600 [Naumovozyma dairenensis CBS 421]